VVISASGNRIVVKHDHALDLRDGRGGGARAQEKSKQFSTNIH